MYNRKIQNTFLIHDYETFGKNPAIDRPAQFAAIRTDYNFKILGKPELFFCKISCDYLPEPEAVLINGITPQKTIHLGINESEFADRIYKLFNVPGTCIIGYNNIKFDDEFSRNLFYRNLYDPYGWSWKLGNSRWDLINVLRTCYTLRPKGIKWPKNENNLPSFKLKHLTYANGIKHDNIHNAMSDVYATLEIAKLINKIQPKLFNYLYFQRSKNQLKKLINNVNNKLLLHISIFFKKTKGNLTCITPLFWHPHNSNIIIVCELNSNIRLLENLNIEKIFKFFYKNNNKIINNIKIPLKLININQCPIILPIKILNSTKSENFDINIEYCLKNLIWLNNRPQIKKKILNFFNKKFFYKSSKDVDLQLYKKFFIYQDIKKMNIIHNTFPENIANLKINFLDKRLKVLLFKYRARNFQYTLNKNEKLTWLKYLKKKFKKENIIFYINKLKLLSDIHKNDKHKLILLNMLYEYLKKYKIKFKNI